MSLPVFPDIPEGFTFESSIFQIMTSIAMEEIGLSHIINAEGEKLQYILGTLPDVPPPEPPPSIDDVIEVNDSIQEVLRSISFNHMFLSAKMSDALKAYMQYLCYGGSTGPSGPTGLVIPDVGDSVLIGGVPWYVAREVVDGSGTYRMLVSEIVLADAIQFNPTQNSYYNGSNLQSVITELYESMSIIHQIAVVPDLGNHSQYVVTEPTPQMAGTQTEDIFFALTWQDVTNLGTSVPEYGAGNWWSRSPFSATEVWVATSYGMGMAPLLTSEPADTTADVVVGVFVKVA